jgi:kinetochore protein Spc25
LQTRLSSCAEQDKERSVLALQASIAATTLRACEHVLRCVIEGIERDQILIRFTHVDPLNPSREFSFVLDVSAHFYKGLSALSKPFGAYLNENPVLASTPLLPNIPILVDDLNESRDVYSFIRRARQLYIGLVQQ